ncbi:nitrilase-related carbon-nitrogen hydrolase [Trinickia caryophylli]|nr:nitrilase-related carbon-nitrogen hydrolase [Trinickia caryophylli]WQE14014.1 nitrilase-related carbon-nitrogen hydrolase [Trinickia caryophylli]
MSSLPSADFRVAAMPFVCDDARLATPGGLSFIADRLADARRQGVRLAVFPEMCLAPASLLIEEASVRRRHIASMAEPIDGAMLRGVCSVVERTGVAAGVGWLEGAEDGRLFNSYLVCLPGGLRFRHRKLFVAGHRHLSGGDRYTVFATPWGVRAGILIGSDNYLVENARAVALLGATLLIAPHRPDRSEIAGGGMGRDWFVQSLPARAADNGTFVIFSSGGGASGRDAKGPPDLGDSFIADPAGCVLARGAGRCGAVAEAAIDGRLAESSVARRWMTARQPDLYDVLSAVEGPTSSVERYAGAATAGGSIALSFAVVGRNPRRG